MKRKTTIILGMVILVFVLSGCQKNNGKKGANNMFYNPIDVSNGMGDPWVIQHDGYYYYTRSDGATVSITKSKNLTDIMVNTAYAKTVYEGFNNRLTELWAPEIYFYKGLWYCYFAADVNEAQMLSVFAGRTDTDAIFGMAGFTAELQKGKNTLSFWAVNDISFDALIMNLVPIDE